MAARNRTRKILHTKPLGDGHFDSEISPRDHQKKSEHPDRDSEERRDLERRRRARFAKSRAANGREDGGSRVFLCRKAAAVPKPERRGTRMTYAKLTRRKTPSRQGKKKKRNSFCHGHPQWSLVVSCSFARLRSRTQNSCCPQETSSKNHRETRLARKEDPKKWMRINAVKESV